MRRLRPQEDQDEGRNVRRRPAWWNVFNRPYWNPFDGEPRPHQRQQIVRYPPEDVVAEPGAVEDVDDEDDETEDDETNAEHVAEPRVTGFSTGGETDILLHPNNANRRTTFSRSFLGEIRYSLDQRLDNQHRGEETAEQERINVNPEAARRYQDRLLAERRAALEWDAETARIRQIKLLVQLENRRIAVIEGHVDYRWGQISSGTRSQNSYY